MARPTTSSGGRDAPVIGNLDGDYVEEGTTYFSSSDLWHRVDSTGALRAPDGSVALQLFRQPPEIPAVVPSPETPPSHSAFWTSVEQIRPNDAELDLSSPADWYLSLPDKVRRRHFSPEEQDIIFNHGYTDLPVKCSQQPLCPHSRAKEALLKSSWKTSNPLGHQDRLVFWTERQASGPAHICATKSVSEEQEPSVNYTSYYDDSSEDEDLEDDIPSFAPPKAPERPVIDRAVSRTHQKMASVDCFTGHSRPRRSSFRRTLSTSVNPFSRSSTSTAPPGRPEMTLNPPRSRSNSILSKHRRNNSIPLIDTDAIHYKDPEARLKMKVYLSSPQKFDEAVEFGFPANNDPEVPPVSDMPPRLPDPRDLTQDGTTFLKDDRFSFFDDPKPTTDEEQEPSGQDSRSIHSYELDADDDDHTEVGVTGISSDHSSETVPADSPVTPCFNEDIFGFAEIPSLTLASFKPKKNAETITVLPVSPEPLLGPKDDADSTHDEHLIHYPPAISQRREAKVVPKTPHVPRRLIKAEPRLSLFRSPTPSSKQDLIGEMLDLDRDMTLRITLTRPDLRSDDDVIYGWQSFKEDPFALEQLEFSDDVTGESGVFAMQVKHSGLMKRLARKVRLGK